MEDNADPAKRNVTISNLEGVLVHIAFGNGSLQLKTGMTDAATARAIGDAMLMLGRVSKDVSRIRVEVDQLRAHGAEALVFAKDFAYVLVEVIGVEPGHVFNVCLGDWVVWKSDIPTTPAVDAQN